MPGLKTQADMKARIAAEIFRSDLTAQIANAITDAISFYASERFWFNEPRLDQEPTFNTVAGVSTYGAEALDQIALAYTIDYLTYVQGNATFKIYRRQPEEIQLLNQNGTISGPPDEFTWAGSAITIYPVPDTAYPISMFGQINMAAPQSDTEVNNVWMNEAEILIRCRAKYEIATHITKNAALATIMSPDEDGGAGGKAGATWRAFADLKRTTNRRVGTGRISAMPF